MPLCYSAIPSRSLRRDGADLKGVGISQQVVCRAKFAFAQQSGAMKAPVGLLSDRTVLRSKMEGLRPDKFRSRCAECRQCKEKHGFPAGVQKVCKSVQSPRKWKIHEESYDSSLDFGALEGTRIPGPLIKRAHRAEHSDFRSFEFTSFLCKAS